MAWKQGNVRLRKPQVAVHASLRLSCSSLTAASTDIRDVNTQTLKKLCASFPGAVETLYPAPSNVLVYTVGGKTFAYFKTSDPEKWRFSVRVFPERFLELTDTPGIRPARYMGRFHWVTIVKVESMPERYLTELVQWSYWKAFGALTRKKQAELGRQPP
jgi:predicted DNA-binding protein (MmcQ/YjbR family)